MELNDPILSRDEVYRRIGGCLDLISDPKIRDDVIELTRRAPEYFWIRPGSYSGYHNGTRYGLWHHTLKLCHTIDVLAPAKEAQGVMTKRDIDRALAAAILHDQRKNGEDIESEQTSNDHPRVMAELVREHSDLDELVARAIEEHMGGFDQEPYPSSEIADLVHTADMIASADTMGVGLPTPIPEELDSLVYTEVTDDE